MSSVPTQSKRIKATAVEGHMLGSIFQGYFNVSGCQNRSEVMLVLSLSVSANSH